MNDMKKTWLLLLALALLFGASTAFAQNELCYNASFGLLDEESGLPEGWYSDGWLTLPDEMLVEAVNLDGNTVIHLKAEVENDVRLCQDIPVEPDSYYELSCDVMVGEALGGAGANLSVLNSLALSQPAVDNGQWQRLTLQGKTGPDQTNLTLALRLGGYSALTQGEAWFKNVSAVPLAQEPESFVSFATADAGEEGGDSIASASKLPLMVLLTLALVVMAVWARGVFTREPSLDKPFTEGKYDLALLLIAGFLLRCIFSLLFVGHSTDINCFLYWSSDLAANGPASFYTSGGFADYPPGYMLVLYALGLLRRLLGLTFGSPGDILLIKMPAIAADLILAYWAYRLVKRRGGASSRALGFAGAIALNPLMAFLSGGWGQIDSILALLLLASLDLFFQERRIWAGAIYGLAVLMKPQALMMGPLLAAMYFIALPGQGWKRRLRDTVLAVLAAFGVILVLSLPFWADQPWNWLLDKYTTTATSYAYASIEAFNLMALLGGNWRPVTDSLGFLSYGAWGTGFIVLSVLCSVLLFWKGKKQDQGRRAGLLSASFLFAALFTAGHYMHERYLFPALVLLVFALIEYGDRRLYTSLAWLSVTLLVNCFAAFVIVDWQEARGPVYDVLTRVCSFAEVAGFGYFACACYDILWRGNSLKPLPAKSAAPLPLPVKPEPELGKNGRLFTRRDHLFCWGLTAVYTAVSLFGLGSSSAPETYWKSTRQDAPVTLTAEEGQHIDEIWVFGGIGQGALELTLEDGTSLEFEQVYDDMYRWVTAASDVDTQSVTFRVTRGSVWLCEVALFNEKGELLHAAIDGDTDPSSEHGAWALLDEQNTVPEAPSSYNGMYFDELYHARTAYEHLHGLRPYENSHPPLGKIIIMTGVAIFGMNPFGWRIMGALMGAGMLPILYAFSKRLFKQSHYALLATFLFAFDFMHFTQTRIATIDVYGVFFILLMFDFMYQYYCMNFMDDGLKKTLKPLALSGVFFALGAASKWICFYAGAGLAVIFFTSLVQRYLDYRRAQRSMREYWGNTVKTLLWCCLFFLAVPAAVYLLSYLPCVFSEAQYDLKAIWDNQVFMFTYHSGLEATHYFQSSWWEWPFTLMPMWYYWSGVSATGSASAISAFGNPAVWWVCTVGTGVLISLLLRRKMRGDKKLFVLLVGVGANYLPWVLISRCTFIYHFFATVPFILLLTVSLLQWYELSHPGKVWIKNLKWIWMGVALGLFVLFYPVLAGVEVPVWYLKMLEWFPRWVFEV